MCCMVFHDPRYASISILLPNTRYGRNEEHVDVESSVPLVTRLAEELFSVCSSREKARFWGRSSQNLKNR